MINSYDIRPNSSIVVDPYSLMFQQNAYNQRPFGNNLYFPSGPPIPNSLKPPNFPVPPVQQTWNPGDPTQRWLYNKVQPTTPTNQQIALNALATEHSVALAEKLQENVTKTIEKSTEGILEEDVQIIEIKERCYNKWCPLKGKQPNPREMKKVTINGTYRTLCKRCVTAFENRQYCPFCFEIYLDGSTQNDGKDWVLCERKQCNKWVHIDCEEEDIRAGLQDHLAAVEYFCPDCRHTYNLSVGTAPAPKPANNTRSNAAHTSHKKVSRSDFLFRRRTIEVTREDPPHYVSQRQAKLTTSSHFSSSQNSKRNHMQTTPKIKLHSAKLSMPQPRIRATPSFYFGGPSVLDSILTSHGVRMELNDSDIKRDLRKLREIEEDGDLEHNETDKSHAIDGATQSDSQVRLVESGHKTPKNAVNSDQGELIVIEEPTAVKLRVSNSGMFSETNETPAVIEPDLKGNAASRVHTRARRRV